jgi:hypothetical protein
MSFPGGPRPPYSSGGFRPPGPRQPRGSQGGFAYALVIIVVVICLLYAFLQISGASLSAVTQSAHTPPDKLNASLGGAPYVIYTDGGDESWGSEMYLFDDAQKNFWNQTGVTPYVIITADYAKYSDAQMKEITDALYTAYVPTESGVLLHISDNGAGDWTAYVMPGKGATSVLDAYGLDQMLNIFESNWYSDKTEGALLADTLNSAAARIMTNPADSRSKLTAFVVAVIALVIVISIVKRNGTKRKEAEARQAEANARILNADIEDIPTDATDDSTLN